MPFSLELGVYNAAGERVRQLFSGPSAILPSTFALTASSLLPGLGTVELRSGDGLGSSLGLPAWDGTNDQGQLLSSGVYYLKVQTRDPFGQTSATVLPVQLLAVGDAQILALEVFNSAGEQVASLPLSPAAAAGGVRLLNAVVIPGESPLQMQTTDIKGLTSLLNWYGLNAAGVALASGSYTMRAASQGPGHADVQFSFTILNSAVEAPAAPHIAPNPVPAGAAGLTVLAPGGATPWSVELYDLSGALVASGSAGPGVAATLPLGSVSGGIYLAVVRTRDAHGLTRQWTLKAAILR